MAYISKGQKTLFQWEIRWQIKVDESGEAVSDM